MSSLLESKPEDANGDLVERGQTTYRERLASLLESSHDGEFVAVEPDSAQYFLGNTATAALIAARAAMPNNLFTLPASVERPRIPYDSSKVDYCGVRRQVAAFEKR